MRSSSLKKEALLLFVFIWSAFLLTASATDESEAGASFLVSKQILHYGQTGFPQRPDPLMAVAPNGLWYESHEVLNGLFLVPDAFLCEQLEASVSALQQPSVARKFEGFTRVVHATLYCALTISVFFVMLRKTFQRSFQVSVISSLLLAFTTQVWTFSRVPYDGVLQMLLLTVSMFALFTYGNDQNRKLLALSFFCGGLAFNTRITSALFIVCSAVYGAAVTGKETRKQAVVVAALSLMPSLLWQAHYNYMRCGNAFLSPIQLPAQNNQMTGNLLLGMLGLIASPGKSFFVYAPLTLLSIFVGPSFIRKYRMPAIVVYSFTLLFFIVHAKIDSWWGHWGYGPRYFVTLVPIIFLPCALCFEELWSKLPTRIACILLAIWGFVLAAASIITDFGFRLTYNEAVGISDQQLAWSFAHAQSIDVIVAAFQNIARLWNHSPYPTLAGTNLPMNAWPAIVQQASGTLNVWPMYLHLMGYSDKLIAVICMPLIAVFVLSGFLLLRVWQRRCLFAVANAAEVRP